LPGPTTHAPSPRPRHPRQAFASQVEEQLPAFENEDWGLLLYGLASMGQPLSPSFLSRLSTHAGARLHSLSGEGLGLLVWGLAQYGGPLPLVVDNELGWGSSDDDDDADDGGGGAEQQQQQQRRRKKALPQPKQQRTVPPQQLDAMERRRQEKLEAWWAGFYAECGLKWGSIEGRGAALMLVGLGLLDEAGALPALPPGEVQRELFGALRAKLGGRHDGWGGLLAALRRAARMDPYERFPVESAWFSNLVLDWGLRSGLEVPEGGMGALLAAAADGGGMGGGGGGGLPAEM